MVHAGYEASAVLGGNKKLGDTWKMLTWTLSGKMGGLKGGRPKKNGNGLNGEPRVSAPANEAALAHAGGGGAAAAKENEVFRIL